MEKQLLYFYDALCGWCYGFSPVILELKKKYESKISFNVFSGGMILGDRIAPIRTMSAYIKQAYPRVEETTGVEFGKQYLSNILNQGEYISNSLPPSIALTVFKSLKPELQLEFAHNIQSAFYHDGLDLNDVQTYLPLLKQHGIDSNVFLQKFEDNAFKEATLNEFQFVQKLGISGFPTLVFGENGKGNVIAVGYKSFESLDQILQNAF